MFQEMQTASQTILRKSDCDRVDAQQIVECLL